jgi:hypothetical protein
VGLQLATAAATRERLEAVALTEQDQTAQMMPLDFIKILVGTAFISLSEIVLLNVLIFCCLSIPGM